MKRESSHSVEDNENTLGVTLSVDGFPFFVEGGDEGTFGHALFAGGFPWPRLFMGVLLGVFLWPEFTL